MQVQERSPGERQRLVLGVLRERGHPMPARSIWQQLRTKDVQIMIKNVEECLSSMAKRGLVVRQGDPGNMVYALPPANGEPMRTKEADKEIALASRVVPISPIPPSEKEGEKTEVVLDAVFRALKVGQYTINAAAWTIADDHDSWIELLTTALEIDPNTRHPRTKKLKFEQSDEILRVRAWLAQQTGEPLTSDMAAIERDREAAFVLAETAEQRAKEAESRVKAAEERARAAEERLQSVVKAIGGLS